MTAMPHPVDSRLRGNDGLGVVGVGLFHPRSRVRHWDRLWPSAVKGEGILLVGVVLCRPTTAPLDCGLDPQ